MKKTILGILIVAILATSVWFVMLLLPRTIASYHIHELGKNFDKPAKARAAYNKLIEMGRGAVPSLLENGLHGDPEVTAARNQNCPPQIQGLDWLNDLMMRRRQSPKQFRADVCALTLLTAWRSGWLSQDDMARLLPLYEDHCLWIVRRTMPLDLENAEVLLAYYQPFHEIQLEGELWAKRRVQWVVDGKDVKSAQAIDESTRWANYSLVTEPVRRRGPELIFSRARGSVSSFNLRLADLGVGHHSVLARIQLGPGTVGNEGLTNDPPPWHVEFAVGPLEFEIVSDIVIEARTNSDLDTTIGRILDEWKPSIELDRKSSRLAVQFPVVPIKFPLPLSGDITVLIDGQTVLTRRHYDDSNLPGQTVPIGDLQSGLHTVQVQFTPDGRRARTTMFDCYWGGQYSSPLTEFELGPASEILRVRTLEREPVSPTQD